MLWNVVANINWGFLPYPWSFSPPNKRLPIISLNCSRVEQISTLYSTWSTSLSITWTCHVPPESFLLQLASPHSCVLMIHLPHGVFFLSPLLSPCDFCLRLQAGERGPAYLSSAHLYVGRKHRCSTNSFKLRARLHSIIRCTRGSPCPWRQPDLGGQGLFSIPVHSNTPTFNNAGFWGCTTCIFTSLDSHEHIWSPADSAVMEPLGGRALLEEVCYLREGFGVS